MIGGRRYREPERIFRGVAEIRWHTMVSNSQLMRFRGRRSKNRAMAGPVVG